jgi:hypothetical protein
MVRHPPSAALPTTTATSAYPLTPPTDRPLQLPIPPPSNPPHNLHLRLRALRLPWYNRPQKGRLARRVAHMEGRAGGRAPESVCEHCVCGYGCKSINFPGGACRMRDEGDVS